MREMAGEGPFDYMVDLGTGTGRVLAVFADRVVSGSGIDNNVDMLKVARHKLAAAGFNHLKVRQGDLHLTPIEAGTAQLVTLHQVLHYLDDPAIAIAEAVRLLAPSGCLLIVDFESHTREDFRDVYAHRRLGFSDSDISNWAAAYDLTLSAVDTVSSQDAARPNVKIWRLQAAAKKKASSA